MLRGVVSEFDEHVGLGVVTDSAGARFPFHCAEIADGTRTIEVGKEVNFDVLTKLGRIEAAGVAPLRR
jgi:CspA family cold shock protein